MSVQHELMPRVSVNAAWSTVETFGPSLDLPTRMLQGRMLKLSMLFKF